jgi:hypothetical protein
MAKRKRRAWTKKDIAELKAHSKSRTPVSKISKVMKRTVGALRRKAGIVGIRLGHPSLGHPTRRLHYRSRPEPDGDRSRDRDTTWRAFAHPFVRMLRRRDLPLGWRFAAGCCP